MKINNIYIKNCNKIKIKYVKVNNNSFFLSGGSTSYHQMEMEISLVSIANSFYGWNGRQPADSQC